MLPIKDILKQIDELLEQAYRLIHSDGSKAEDFIDLFWKVIELCYSAVLRYFKSKFPDIEFDNVPIEELLYDDKDEDRIRIYFKNSANEVAFLGALALIFDTEAEKVINGLMVALAHQLQDKVRAEGKDVYITIWSAEDESSCGQVSPGDYYWDEVEPCDHPGCECYLVDVKVKVRDLPELERDISED